MESMEAWYDVNEIPRGVGIVAWLNAAPEFVFAVLIAGLGSLLFDSRSISALIMASPLYFVVFIGVDRLYRSLLLNYCIWAGRFPVNAVTIGPFTVKRNPV